MSRETEDNVGNATFKQLQHVPPLYPQKGKDDRDTLSSGGDRSKKFLNVVTSQRVNMRSVMASQAIEAPTSPSACWMSTKHSIISVTHVRDTSVMG